MRWLLVLALIFALLPLLLPSGAAQSVTPGGTPIAISPDLCEVDVAPRSIESVAALLASPVSEEAESAIATVAAVLGDQSGAFSPPAGSPAEPAAYAAAEDTILAFYACYLSEDLRVTGLVTEYFFLFYVVTDVELVTRGPSLITDEPTPTPVTPVPEPVLGSLIEVREVSVLPSDRLGAIVDLTLPPSAGGAKRTDFVLLVEQDDRYLIEFLWPVSPQITGSGEVATPGAP